jgi:squalene-hopene/tetraprenyl-beta-curcumene cyclase
MNTTDLVHYVSTGERPRPIAARPAPSASYHQLVAPSRLGILRARQFLFSEQQTDGSWCGHAAGDASLASQWILLLAYLGQEHSDKAEQAARTILDAQLPGGGWSQFPGGPVDVSTSVQAYFALKITGIDPTDERLSKARDVIRRHGGADAADVTTRFFLALLGQINYDCCPVIAPEQALFHNTRRQELAPLSVLWSHRPVRDVGLACGVRELFVKNPSDWPAQPPTGWRRLDDRIVAHLERRGWTPLRRRALDRVEAMLLRDAAPDQIARLSFHELIQRLIALDTLGHSAGSQPFDACHDRLLESVVVDDCRDQVWPQLRTNPLADTALVLRSFRASGIPLRELIGPSATSWLARPQRLDPSCDTMEMVWLLDTLRAASDDLADADESLPPDIQVGSDAAIDATAVRAAALQRRAQRVAEHFIRQLLERQNADGGWAPTADNRSPSEPDVTGAVLEALADCGGACVCEAVERAIAYLRIAQRADGGWTSATGVRFVHGTSLAVCGLLAAGVTPEDDAVAAGVNWLVVHQQSLGGWGELPLGPTDAGDDYAIGRVTATQTAWALDALVAAGLADEVPARRGVQFLIDTQDDDGRWPEPHFTLRDAGTGRWFRNDLHAAAWPLLALSRWTVAASAADEATDHPALRLVGVANGD